MDFNADEISVLLKAIMFAPVNVKHGRKFRGFGYVVDERVVDNGGFSGSGVRPLAFYAVFKVWDPARKCYDSFNGKSSRARAGAEYSDFHEDEVQVSDAVLLPAFVEYLDGVAKACVSRCGNDLNWRRNYLRCALTTSSEALDILCKAIEREQDEEDPGNREERLLAERECLADMQSA